MLVTLVTGTRPQIIKSAPVIHSLLDAGIECEFIHTGQHYDYELAGAFIDEFDLRPPLDLKIGPGDYVYQVYAIMERLNKHVQTRMPDYFIVPGDTTSALGAAMVGFKVEVPVCHLEAGLRRYDYTYQEELNRRLIDHGSSGLFAPTDVAVHNLEREEVLGRIYQIGDTMYDVLKSRLPVYSSHERKMAVRKRTGLDTDDYAVLTLHRRENVDDKEMLSRIVAAINALPMTVVFPIHPRTRKQLELYDLHFDRSHIHLTDPLDYDDFMSLIADTKLVISDSGGVQKECYLLNTPLVSIHTRTEWVETYDAGSNLLTRVDPEEIVRNCESMYGKKMSNCPSVYGDGHAADKIPPIIESGEITIPTDRRKEPFADYFRL